VTDQVDASGVLAHLGVVDALERAIGCAELEEFPPPRCGAHLAVDDQHRETGLGDVEHRMGGDGGLADLGCSDEGV
jgi:hypothetical protein